MTVSIAITDVRDVTVTPREESGALAVWGVIFQINRNDGVGTAIGITLRCEDEDRARGQALAELKSFLSEAAATAQGMIDSTKDSAFPSGETSEA